jgi:hypothetical protein
MSASGSNIDGANVPAAVPAAIPVPATVTVVQGPAEVSPPLVDPVVFPNTVLLRPGISARNMRTSRAFYEILSRAFLDMNRVLRQVRRSVGPGGTVLPGLDISPELTTIHLRTMAGRLAFYMSTPGLDVADLASSDDDVSSTMSDFSVEAMRTSFDSIIESIEDMS